MANSVEFGCVPSITWTPEDSDTSPASPYDREGGNAPERGSHNTMERKPHPCARAPLPETIRPPEIYKPATDVYGDPET